MKTNLGVKENPMCGLCGKDFYSIKALHGHMRSHPDRSWRGIQPPPTTPPPSSSSSSSSLPCWSVTAKRGRKSISPSVSVSASEDQVVSSLIFLSKSEYSDNHGMNMGELNSNAPIGIPTKLEASQEQIINCEMGFRKRKISSTRVKKIKQIIGDQLKNLSDSVPTEYQIQLKDPTPIPIPIPIPTPTKKLYRCNSCNKEFSSHQALGGHKSSHNKTSKTTTLLDSTVQMKKRRMLDFDLNELPPMDDHGEEPAIQ